jgi:hypothetical protein
LTPFGHLFDAFPERASCVSWVVEAKSKTAPDNPSTTAWQLGSRQATGDPRLLRELMDRMGHSSTRAALIYQHSSDERQRKLADAIGEAARAAPSKTATVSGTHVAREANNQS